MSSHARTAPRPAVPSVLGAVALATFSACHVPTPRDATAQSRLDGALTSRPKPSMVASARPRLRLACTRGDAAACSSYGLVEELGVDTGPATSHARELYARACTAGNVRGCAHLGRALLHGIGGARDARSAASLLARACADGDAAGCGTLGAAWLDGDVGLPRRVAAGMRMLEKACSTGDGAACTRLGDALVSGELGTSAIGRAEAAWDRGCAGGHADACRRLTATSATETLPL